MKARVLVTLKPSVFDPQGHTIVEALHSLGYATVADVRQGFQRGPGGLRDPLAERQQRGAIDQRIIRDGFEQQRGAEKGAGSTQREIETAPVFAVAGVDECRQRGA